MQSPTKSMPCDEAAAVVQLLDYFLMCPKSEYAAKQDLKLPAQLWCCPPRQGKEKAQHEKLIMACASNVQTYMSIV